MGKYIILAIAIIAGVASIFNHDFLLPMWIFLAAWDVVNAIEEMLDDKIEKLLKEREQDE